MHHSHGTWYVAWGKDPNGATGNCRAVRYMISDGTNMLVAPPMTPEQSLVEGENPPVMPGSLESRGSSLGTLLVLFSGGAACPNSPNEFPCFVDRHCAPGG
jgi:hypothetical protein